MKIDQEPLYKRRRRALLVGVTGLLALPAVFNIGESIAERMNGVECSGTQVVTVESGDTAWDLASSHIEGSDAVDKRGLMEEIIELNPAVIYLGSLATGEKLVIPISCVR